MLVVERVVYEVKSRCALRGFLGDAGGTQPAATQLLGHFLTKIGGFIAMKLQPSTGHQGGCVGYFSLGGIHEQQHGVHKGRQQFGQFSGLLGRHMAWAGGIQHKANSVGTCLHSGCHVLGAGQAANFDGDLGHGDWPGSQS